MSINDDIQLHYKELEKELETISKDAKKRKADIDIEIKERKSKIKKKISGLQKFLEEEGLIKKKTKIKNKNYQK